MEYLQSVGIVGTQIHQLEIREGREIPENRTTGIQFLIIIN